MNDIVRSLAKAYSINLDGLRGRDSEKLSQVIEHELGAIVTPQELASALSVSALATLVQARLPKNGLGMTVLDIYHDIEKLAREEYHPNIPYQWTALWDEFLNVGNWFTKPDGLDAVEIVLRMEDKYRIKISDEIAAAMVTVGDTVRYLWRHMT
ncbi:MAG TPA: hypothetical protein VJV03_04960 [Pyrinomonadaceae bacterium]|nr:hypothetical protein [Pyrinomonadaceae bacterium]